MSRRHRNRTSRRFLSMETLEGRRLLVVGIVPPEIAEQNFGNPEDADHNGVITPRDALLVINELNNPNRSSSPSSISRDVDGNGVVSPRDALLIINRLNSGSDKSSVPPEQRAIGLRKALDAGYVPPNLTLPEAQEMLETLENGGHYEAGDRFRDGEMINLRRQGGETDGAVAEAESASADAPVETVELAPEEYNGPTTAPKMVEEEDPFALFDSADETLSDSLHDASLWHDFVTAEDADVADFVDRLSERIAEGIDSIEARDELVRAVNDAIDDGNMTAEDIVETLRALRSTLGDAHSQISQVFANLDIEGIIEQLGVDLGTLAEAIIAHEHSDPSEHESVFAEFLSREYLNSLQLIIP